MIVTAENLNDVMEFDHVIRVHPDGTVTDVDRYEASYFAPGVMFDDVHPDGDLRKVSHPDGWTFLIGYSGQEGYSGPVMHSSEFIGGGLARDILAEPGDYVAVVIDAMSDDDDPDGEPIPDGWGVLRYND